MYFKIREGHFNQEKETCKQMSNCKQLKDLMDVKEQMLRNEIRQN